MDEKTYLAMAYCVLATALTIFAVECSLACAPAACPRDAGSSMMLMAPAPLPPLEPDPEPEPSVCEKTTTVRLDGGVVMVTPVPCRQYDVKRDLGRPQP